MKLLLSALAAALAFADGASAENLLRKKHHKKHHRRTKRKGRKGKRGGSVVGTAALPFGLLALQKFFQTRKGRKDLKKMSKTVRKSVRKVRRSI